MADDMTIQIPEFAAPEQMDLAWTRDAIAIESPDSPYANVIVVRATDKDSPVLKKLLKAYKSDEVKAFIKKEFKDSLSPAR